MNPFDYDKIRESFTIDKDGNTILLRESVGDRVLVDAEGRHGDALPRECSPVAFPMFPLREGEMATRLREFNPYHDAKGMFSSGEEASAHAERMSGHADRAVKAAVSGDKASLRAARDAHYRAGWAHDAASNYHKGEDKAHSNRDARSAEAKSDAHFKAAQGYEAQLGHRK